MRMDLEWAAECEHCTLLGRQAGLMLFAKPVSRRNVIPQNPLWGERVVLPNKFFKTLQTLLFSSWRYTLKLEKS